jgi:hypothetical protein
MTKKVNKSRRIVFDKLQFQKSIRGDPIKNIIRKKIIFRKMLFILFVVGLISSVNCAPRPQEEFETQPAFDIESFQSRIPFPQGFSAPTRDSRQTEAEDANNLQQFGVVRYFFELNDLSYRFT